MTIQYRRLVIVVGCLLALAACGAAKKTATPQRVVGGLSAVVTIDSLIEETTKNLQPRSAALLGIYVSEYLSFASTVSAAQGALNGIAIDRMMMDAQLSVTDPDFDLIQAFADALQVDVPDLLNRSQHRQETLDTYTTALTNVATHANERFKELTTALDEQKATLRTQSKERSDADRTLKDALNKKQFSEAGERQKTLLEKQAAYAETDLKVKQTENVVSTLDKFLTLYGRKILAIQQNREALIAGIKTVDVPGIEELKIIERQKALSPGRGGSKFDTYFEVL